MSDANETAEAILIVIKRLAKWITLGVLGIILLLGFAFGVFEGHKYVTNTLPKSQIDIIITTKEEGCTDEYPIKVAVFNGSSKTVKSIDITLSAMKPGHSTNYARWNAEATYDRVLSHGQSWQACWRSMLSEDAPSDLKPADYVWGVDYYSVVFED